jgi:hypothetical protein
MEFHYRFWATCGVGSTVTFEGGAGFMEVTATLEERDAEKAVLRIRCRSRGLEDIDFTETLRPARTSGDPVVEGQEIIDVAGEEWLSRWIETTARHLDRDVTVKSWILEQVPGGIARWQMRERPDEARPLTWTVKSFERK